MSLSGVAVPAILDSATDAKHLQSQWARLYHYGHYVMPNTAVITCLLHLYTTFRTGTSYFALVGLLTTSIAPFTWAFMLPTNKKLVNMGTYELGKDDFPRVRGLVIRWNWLHFTRSFLPLVGAVLAIRKY